MWSIWVALFFAGGRSSDCGVPPKRKPRWWRGGWCGSVADRESGSAKCGLLLIVIS